MSERKHDYVPRNPAQFNFFMKNIIQYVGQKAALGKVIDPYNGE